MYQIAVAPQHRRTGIGTQLLAEVQQQLSNEKVQINNVDEAAENLKLFLEKQGLTNDINQFEMTKKL
jgi:ribosomal protein S18 acetylase RimI-like enzyme